MYPLLALRNLQRRKMRTFLSALGILIGVAMIISLVSVSDGLKKTTADFSKSMGNTIFVVAEGLTGSPMTRHNDVSVVDEIEKIPGVEVVAPLVMVLGQVEGGSSSQASSGGAFFGGQNNVAIVGIDPLKEKRISSDYTKIASGRFIRADDRDSIVLGATTAGVFNKKVGDSITVKIKNDKYTYDVVGIFQTGNSEADTGLVLPITEVQRIASLPSYQINAVRVLPVDTGETEALQRKIKLLVNGVDPSYATALFKTLTSFTDTLQLVTWVIAGIAAFIGGIGITNTMIMSVMEQTKELGILKAVGWHESDILSHVLTESLLISGVGALGGVLLGSGMVLLVLPLVFKGAFSAVLTVPTVLEAVVFALGLGLVGGLLPAKRAADLDPVEAFRDA
jgi:putative ABC transport system permease protein